MSIQHHHKSIEDNFKKWVLGIYWGYIASIVLSFFSFGFALPLAILVWLGSVMVAFNQRKSSGGTIYQSHFQNYITVFWISILVIPAAAVLAGILAGVSVVAVGDADIGGGTGLVIGIIGLVVVSIWAIWRVIKGIMQVKDGLPFGKTVVKLDKLKEIERTKTQIEIGGKDKVEGGTTQGTQAPVNQAPLNQAVNQAPVNQAPVNQAPVNQAPVAKISSWEKEDQSNRVQTSEIEDNSTELESLHRDGILTDDEYETAKKTITIEKNPQLIELEILHKNGVLSDSSYEAARNRVLSNSENEAQKKPKDSKTSNEKTPLKVEKKEDDLLHTQKLYYQFDGIKFKSKEDLESYKKSLKKSE